MKVLIDSREKEPWTIHLNERITEVCHCKVDVGDYSVEGLEETVAIERKKSILEVAQNITQDRFWRTIDRLDKVKHPFFICEFTIDQLYLYPNCSNVPDYLKDKLKIKPEFLVGSITDLMARGISVLFADNSYYAEKIANDILSKFIKQYKC